jgi:hypothetical protein
MRALKKRPPYNLKSRITSALRKVWLWSPARVAIIKKSRLEGNVCYDCEKWSTERCDIDHVKPVVGIEGFRDWNTYIERLFNGELRPLCKPCHKVVTSKQRKARKEYAAKLKTRRRKKCK